jgi:hypothetical protein
VSGAVTVSESIADTAERVALRLAVLVTAALQRDSQLRVTEEQLGIASRDAQVLQR